MDFCKVKGCVTLTSCPVGFCIKHLKEFEEKGCVKNGFV